MPRASWRGFLRLSLVTGPVYLSPATTHTKPIRENAPCSALPPATWVSVALIQAMRDGVRSGG